jgi:hypothetical protein
VATSPAAIVFKNNRLTFAWFDGDVQKVIAPFPEKKTYNNYSNRNNNDNTVNNK